MMPSDIVVPSPRVRCEAGDPANAWAFNRYVNPIQARLNAIFSSDIGHFDMLDMSEIMPDAYGLVERGLLTADDSRGVMFGNAVRSGAP